MSSAVGLPIPSGNGAGRSSTSGLPLWRLYTLRACYFVLAAGLGTYVWPTVLNHTSGFAETEGIRCALLAGLGATAVLGFRYPVQMLPLVLFELIWKAVYLAGFALPLWRAHQINDAVAANIQAVLMVVIFIPLIPWRYVWAHYVLQRGDRWR